MILYGIPNCDTVRKARAWLTSHDVEYYFIDYKKNPVAVAQLAVWQHRVGWEVLLNRKGATWRGLPEERRSAVINAAAAAQLMAEFPSLIKRPVLVDGERVQAGFSEAAYSAYFANRG